MREYIEELRENLGDAYWRADHPEVMAVIVGLLTGLISLGFVWLETRVRKAAMS